MLVIDGISSADGASHAVSDQEYHGINMFIPHNIDEGIEVIKIVGEMTHIAPPSC